MYITDEDIHWIEFLPADTRYWRTHQVYRILWICAGSRRKWPSNDIRSWRVYATNEPVHLAKILKIGIQLENGKCLNFLFQGKSYTQPSGGKRSKSQQEKQLQTQVSAN